MKKGYFNKGFTLIELLIVISIIGILAVFVVASFSSTQAKARDARRKGDLDALNKALALWESDSPAGLYPLCPGGTSGPLVCPITNTVNFCKPPDPGCTNDMSYYIKTIPQDPKATASPNCSASASRGEKRGLGYCYRPEPFWVPCVTTNNCNGYFIYFCLENGNDTGPNTNSDGTCASGRNYSYCQNTCVLP